MKLSERLESMLHAEQKDERAIILAAIELTERYEDAPAVVTDEHGRLYVDRFTDYPLRRVRLVVEGG